MKLETILLARAEYLKDNPRPPLYVELSHEQLNALCAEVDFRMRLYPIADGGEPTIAGMTVVYSGSEKLRELRNRKKPILQPNTKANPSREAASG